MTDAIELLRRDHDTVQALLSELESSPHPGQRRAALTQVMVRESALKAIEKQYFWPVVRRRVRDGARLADQAVSQELELSRVLGLLDGLDPAAPRFEPLVRQLAGMGRAHLEFEERQVWPGLRLALSEPELAELGVRLEQGRRLTSEVLRLAGRIAVATDRIREVLADRTGR
jgi:hypothetical protein